MRSILKLRKPQVLEDNEDVWLSDYKLDKSNKTKKYRYRHKDIKETLKNETGFKCVYCEAKIGHNTPGDIEHKIPSSKCTDKHFLWENLTIACTECNRRKNDYYQKAAEFLDPYTDEVDELVEHHGPVVSWKAGNERAEISVRTLQLNSWARRSLIIDKIEKIEAVNNLHERCLGTANIVLKQLLEKQLLEMTAVDSEYSGMVIEILRKKGFEAQVRV